MDRPLTLRAHTQTGAKKECAHYTTTQLIFKFHKDESNESISNQVLLVASFIFKLPVQLYSKPLPLSIHHIVVNTINKSEKERFFVIIMSKYVGLIGEVNVKYRQAVTKLFDYLEQQDVFTKER